MCFCLFVESLEPLDKMAIYQVFNFICHPRENFVRKRKNLTVFDELVASSFLSVLFQIITLSRAVTDTDRVKRCQTFVFNTAVSRKHYYFQSYIWKKLMCWEKAHWLIYYFGFHGKWCCSASDAFCYLIQCHHLEPDQHGACPRGEVMKRKCCAS